MTKEKEINSAYVLFIDIVLVECLNWRLKCQTVKKY